MAEQVETIDNVVYDYDPMAIIAHRCGDEVAAAVMPVAIVEEILAVVQALQDRAEQLALQVEAKQAA